MSRARLWLAVSAAAAVTILTRLPFRSEFLFSWDSANYALAMSRIDIVAHRPHPPGYLGYVFAARLIDLVLYRLHGIAFDRVEFSSDSDI